MSYRVRWSKTAERDLDRFFDFVLARELESESGDIEVAARMVETVRRSVDLLAHSPFTCRKAADGPFLRELVIPSGASGFVALFEIVDAATVIIAALRHQREDDYLG